MLYFWRYIGENNLQKEHEDILEIVNQAKVAEDKGHSVFIGSLLGNKISQHYATKNHLMISYIAITPNTSQSFHVPCKNLADLCLSLNTFRSTYFDYRMTQRYATNNLFCFRFVLDTSSKSINWEQEGF